MTTIRLEKTPLLPGRSPVELHAREAGSGPALLLLHGGWGYEAYPFDAAFDALAPHRRVVAPDRTGYGRSPPLAALPRGFHRAMAEETLAVMDALGAERASLWGHSDGAVIAAWTALLAPERVSALVLEALHLFPLKRRSVAFFEAAVTAPETFGEPVVEACRRDHGERWREVLAAGGRAWLALIDEGRRGLPDLFDGRLGEVRAPALLLHGRRDPRTEPGELEAAAAALPRAQLALLDAGHAPHAGRATAAQAAAVATAFLLGADRPAQG